MKAAGCAPIAAGERAASAALGALFSGGGDVVVGGGVGDGCDVDGGVGGIGEVGEGDGGYCRGGGKSRSKMLLQTAANWSVCSPEVLSHRK